MKKDLEMQKPIEEVIDVKVVRKKFHDIIAVLNDEASDNETKSNAVKSILSKAIYDKKNAILDIFFNL